MCISVGETSIKLRLIQQRHIIFLGCELKKDQKKRKKKTLKLAFVHIFKLEALRPVKLETFPEMLKVLFDEFLSVCLTGSCSSYTSLPWQTPTALD